MRNFTLPENLKIVNCSTPQSSSAANTGDYVSLKTVNRLWAVATLNNSVSATTAQYITVYEATSTTGAGAAATTSISYQWWKNGDTTGSDSFVAQTAAYRLLASTGATTQMIVCQIDPAQLTATYDCVRVDVGASGTTGNISCVNYFADVKYKEDVPPAIISS